MVTSEEKIVKTYSCSLHGRLLDPHCPYCSLCEHGMAETQQCDKCAADTSWITNPISDDELDRLERQISYSWGHLGIGRNPPMKRNYQWMPLLPKLLAEYRALRTAATFLDSKATPQVTPELELEKESGGRWLAEFTRFPGVAAYGPSKEEAIRNAAKVLIESEQASPQLEHLEEKCGTHGCPKCVQVSESRQGNGLPMDEVTGEQASPTPELGTCQDHHATITPSTPHARTPYCCEWRVGEVERG